MKKTFFATICFIAATLLAGVAAAHPGAPVSSTPILAVRGYLTIEIPATDVTPKVQASFSKTFGDVTPQWSKTEKNHYLAEFSKDGQNTHALFTKGGYMLYSVTQGSKSMLPASVQRLVAEVYADYDITYVTKATSMDITAWIATLQLGKRLLKVKIIDNEVVEETRFLAPAK